MYYLPFQVLLNIHEFRLDISKMFRLLTDIGKQDLNLSVVPISNMNNLGCFVCISVNPHNDNCCVQVTANDVSSVDTKYIVLAGFSCYLGRSSVE